ncbi:lipase 1 [Aethina tumida]|uniref:lipase 1 n=1 Tax=Aethina tumida TaxID=116153 RepID=UPI002148A6D4|nr:lipase 1 [Aethina tumida]
MHLPIIFGILYFFKISAVKSEAIKICDNYPDYCTNISGTCRNAPMMTKQEILESWGCTVEEIIYVTEDGFQQSMLMAYKGPQQSDKYAIMFPGLFNSRLSFISVGENSLAYPLIQDGYTVMLPTYRNSDPESSTNIYMNSDDPKFNEYCLDTLAEYDVKAAFDQAIIKCNKSFVVVAYSMGCAVSSMFLIENPSYQDYVLGMVFCAPAIYLKGTSLTTLSYTVPVAQFVLEVTSNCGVSMPFSGYSPNCLTMLSQEETLQTFYGPSSKTDWSTVPWSEVYDYGNSSCNCLKQFTQIIITDAFAKLLYDPLSDLNYYNLSALKVLVAILYGENDLVVPSNNTIRLINELSNGCGRYQISGYNHKNFLDASDTTTTLHPLLLSLCNNFS